MTIKPSHMKVIGSTQRGKTTYCNELHREFPSHVTGPDGRRVPRYSIFVDTKGIDPIWGTKVRQLDPLGKVVLNGQKLVYDPPRLPTGIDWAVADLQLQLLWGSVQAAAQRAKWTSDRDPWIQVLVDEAQQWQGVYTGVDGKRRRHPDTLDDMAARGLGMGLRLVYITQYPAGLTPTTRNNLGTSVVYGLEDEGQRVLQSWGWPAADIKAWTDKPYHFASYHAQLGWRYHDPRPV